MKAITKEEFLKKAEKRMTYLEGENYHSLMSDLCDIVEAVQKASDSTWKDVVVERVLSMGHV